MQIKQPELWGGVECTINRVGDDFSDQVARLGHDQRFQDFDLFAGLGIRKLRHGVLWERIVTRGWAWADRSLGRIRQLGMEPIVGLVHHGSGPLHTSLLDPDFPVKLARHAEAVATRYPWVQSYTPVNEPLTTARFSGLYGHWYPHGRDDRSFVCCLLNELKGTVLSMRAIRRITPEARLVQTEDIGRTWSTAPIRYQADFDNLRRWLTFDLLTGRVHTTHPIFGYLRRAGVAEAEVLWFRDNPCPPDVLGLNYYLTSDRFLDHRVDLYPAQMAGGNGRDAYVDVEAVRIRPEGIAGIAMLLEEAWKRYQIPVAVTEVHNGSHLAQQVLWMNESFLETEKAMKRGVPVAGITPWALLGSFDWCSLVTRRENIYEPGIFRIGHNGRPEPTLLAEALKRLTQHRTLLQVDEDAWWHDESRLLYPAELAEVPAHAWHQPRPAA